MERIASLGLIALGVLHVALGTRMVLTDRTGARFPAVVALSLLVAAALVAYLARV